MSQQRTRAGGVARWIVVGWSFAAVIGCGGSQDSWEKARPPVYTARVTVKFNGAPVAGATVALLPVDGQHSAYGETDAAGVATLTTFEQGDGAPAGEFTVTVSKNSEAFATNPDNPDGPPVMTSAKKELPEKYNDATTSGLKATISATGPNEVLMELKP